jgi:hypothetical protein
LKSRCSEGDTHSQEGGTHRAKWEKREEEERRRKEKGKGKGKAYTRIGFVTGLRRAYAWRVTPTPKPNLTKPTTNKSVDEKKLQKLKKNEKNEKMKKIQKNSI